MERERVVFAFFIVLALTLNFGFFLGDIDNPDHHEPFELGAAIVVSLIATVLKFGDRSPMGSTLLATSLVADLQLIVAAALWGFAANLGEPGVSERVFVSIVSLSGGALLANFISVVLLVAETVTVRR
ncbi:MAG: DUF6394 family protein [Xanthomonadales bacterium]|jgi:hypothetical protein|nr:DUF6394 family protein [Xanthomonadales bacterium]